MVKVEGVSRHRAEKICILYHGEQVRMGIGPKTRLSIDREFDPGANVNDLSSTPVKLYRAIAPSVRVPFVPIEYRGEV